MKQKEFVENFKKKNFSTTRFLKKTDGNGWSRLRKATTVVLSLFVLFNSLTFNIFADENEPINKDYQVISEGGENSSADGMVSVSKTLKGTDYENIFDITLQVQTKVNLKQLYSAQDTAVAIVMDISNTMATSKLADGVTRYNAAIASATSFIENFQKNAEVSSAKCKLGYVAFNTSAHQIVAMSDCNTEDQRNTIISNVKSGCDSIINASGYGSSPTRFTNIEAGLKMANDMLNAAGISNKYIIFLSDGFPTTYVKEGCTGYNPYMNSSQNSDFASQSAGGIGSDGYFYNQKTGQLCTYGTSYSDKGADRAMAVAENIKKDTKVYSIGIGLGDQQINEFAAYIVDCYGNDYDYGTEGQNYIIGNDTASFKSWLKNKIASGYYWDSTDTTGLQTAYDEIFENIKETTEESVKNVWLATDPMSATSLSNVEFLHFYDVNGNKVEGNLVNTTDPMTENTATVTGKNGTDYIYWDLKNSVCVESGTETSRTYTYKLKYRIRLDTGKNDFVMGKEYETNGTTFLNYQTEEDGVLSEVKRIDFPVPSVKGYVGELSFNKADALTFKSLKGVTFTMQHSANCSVCKAVDNLESIEDLTTTSDDNGVVSFENVPSGHEYIMFESKALDEYIESDDVYAVKVAYSELSTDLKSNTIYNRKVLYAQDLTIQKEVKEESADGTFNTSNTDEAFDFTVKFSKMDKEASFSSTIGDVTADDSGNATMTFSLKSGDSVRFYDVPVGVQYQVMELASNYTASYKIDGTTTVKSEFANTDVKKDIETEIETVDADEDAVITFSNTKFLDRTIHLTKSIGGNTDIASALQGNKMYHLDGAEYEVVIDGQVAETLTTDENGEAISKQTYKNGTTGVIREVKAPDGLLLDEAEHEFVAESSDSSPYYEVSVADVPILDSIALTVQKTDSGTGTTPQGNASFAGAVFKYEYYDNTSWTGEPIRTWYFKTNESGLHSYHSDYLADGYASDELYANGNAYLMPLGSIKITEVVAPLGYKVMPVMYATITQSGMGATAELVFTEETLSLLNKTSNNIYEVEEPLDDEILGSLTIEKTSNVIDDSEDVTFAGCEFTVYNKSMNPIKIGDNEVAELNEACLVITIGENSNIASTGCVLPIGTYEVKETNGNDYYECNTEWSYTFTIDGSSANREAEFTCENALKPEVSILKTDKNGNLLSGAILQIKDSEGNIVAEWTTTDESYIIRLAEGTYTLHEYSVPFGYLRAEDVEFTVSKDAENTVTMVDESIAVLVSTGGTGTIITIIGAVMFAGLSIGLVYFGKKKDRKERT